MKKQIFIIPSTIILILCCACSTSSVISSVVQTSAPIVSTLKTTTMPTTTTLFTEPDPLASVTTSDLLWVNNPPPDKSSIYQGEQIGDSYILVYNPTENYLSVGFTLRQYDSDGNYLQQLGANDSFIPPSSYWAVWSPVGKIAQADLQQWKIISVSKTITTPYLAMEVPASLGSGIRSTYLNDLTFTNLSVISYPDGAIGLSGTLYNNDPLGMPTPSGIAIQVFTGSDGNYSLVGYSSLSSGGDSFGMDNNSNDNIPPIPPPQAKDQFVLQLSTNVSVTNGSLTNGIITIEETY